MKNSGFAHLHLHTTYSQLDGYGTPDEYAKRAKKMGFKYLACTDHGNIDALIKFQNACNENDIKPILGCEAYIVNEWKKEKKRGHITLWVKNKKGFRNLCNLLSIANIDGFYYKPRLNFNTLWKYRKGLVIGTACLQSFINLEGGREFFARLCDDMNGDIYAEVMPHNDNTQIKFNRKVIRFAKKYGAKIIATNDCHYIKKADSKVQEVMLAIQRKDTWNNPNRWRFNITGLHLRGADEMRRALDKIGFYKEEYLSNTIEVAEKCSEFRIPKLDIKLPRVPGLEKVSEKEYIWSLCVNSFKSKFSEPITKYPVYRDRLKMEFDLITKKNFERYFLIVWELCEWCRKNGILVGPGRGSVGGSLIAYLLKITSVDPIKHGLIFDRFINNDRIDYPDIDLDFEDIKIHLVKEHLEDLYGEGNVAGVSSFNRLQAKAAIQDVARVFEIPQAEAINFTKMIDDSDGDGSAAKIQMAIDEHESAAEFAHANEDVIKYAKKLVGQVRNYGQHAAALVISMRNIAKSGRCNLIERKGVRLINWEKDDTEYVGLMKLDALSIKLLSILSHALKLIKENHAKDIDLEKLNLDDKKVIRAIASGNNTGVFQLNTWAMTSLIKDMKVTEFSHIVDSLSLVRPGPMESGMTEEYIKRQRTNKWRRMHDVYEEVTKDTYGLLVFQEQVMAVIHKVAGLPYSTADKIRKVIGKKRDVKEFEKYEETFKKGCRKTGYLSSEEANDFWDGLQKWARYGFNRAHSVEYAILGYWCAWLKYYFPTEFICASLTFGAKGKKPELIEEAYRLGLTVQLPKVGISHATEWKSNNGRLSIPFIEVKGIGPAKANEAARSPSPEKKKTKLKFVTMANNTNIKHKGSLGELLDSFGAYTLGENTIDNDIKKLFDFRIVDNPKIEYEKLYKLFDTIRIDKLDDILSGETAVLKSLSGAAKEVSFKGHKKLMRCGQFCDLIDECSAPVPPSPGKYNIAIVGEAPGLEEDKKGKGFVGRSGDEVWKALKKYDRSLFHVTNVAKCFPKKTHKPSTAQIDMCGCTYLKKELEQIKPILVLAFGNTPLEFFTGKKSGVMNMSGQTTWSEEYGCFIAWCLHPAAALYNPDNRHYFIAGMRNFKRLCKIFLAGHKI